MRLLKTIPSFGSATLFAAASLLLPTCGAAGAGSKGFAAKVKTTHPIAYYELESSGGASAVGPSAYLLVGGATTAAPGALAGVADDKCALLNGKDGWVSTTQSGGIATAGSMMA